MTSSYSLTRSLIVLHSISAFFALLVTCLAIGDGGTFSIMLGPIFGTLTIAYHIISLTLICTRDYYEQEAPLPFAFNAVAYFLSLGWLITFIVMAVMLATRVNGITVFAHRIPVVVGSTNPRKLQLLLDPLESALMLDLAIRATFHRQKAQRIGDQRAAWWDVENGGNWEPTGVASVKRSLGSHILVTRTVRIRCH
ncbi:hypothetical protein CPB83DRAFT_212000 [Crepidotus variabilis]|uniref:Uncharacterized protein n=1 Tax=Crepidotus variabilis TaxID=179855 RepID=A0A9P6ETQ2_9AGAR|nr:hypothetical protein CPB83DRAFT_212000 [Crepidotus variabilis]